MIEDVEDDVDEIFGSDFSKAAARVFDKIDNGEAGVLLSSKFVDLIETLEYGFCSEYLTGHVHKLEPN